MKRLLRPLLDRFGGAVGAFQVHRFLAGLERDRAGVTVLDIDNTLADTWPTLTRSWLSERERLAAIEPLEGMKAAAYDTAIARGDRVLFVSHRNWWVWWVTRTWLLRHGYEMRVRNLVLVAGPEDKLAHLRRCTQAAPGRVTYWDDLSHSHETGRVARYEALIAEVEALPLSFHGWQDIARIVEPGSE